VGCLYTLVPVRARTYAHIQTYICTDTHMYTQTLCVCSFGECNTGWSRVYICACTCVHVCMYTYIYRSKANATQSGHICVSAHIPVNACIYTHTCICIKGGCNSGWPHMCICAYACMRVYICAHTYIHTYRRKYV